jgi:small subunit ribosomal protein S1
MIQEVTDSQVEEFDWEAYEADCPTKARKPNPHIKTPKGVKIFSREPYAQELFDLYENHDKEGVVFKIKIGQTYSGKVYGIDDNWASVDIGFRENVYIDLGRESSEIKDAIAHGMIVDVEVTSDKSLNRRGFVVGSIGAGMATAKFNEILASIEEGNTAYVGKVLKMIPGGGYMVDIQGVECFMPGSLAGINKLHDFESIIGNEMYFVPVTYSHDKSTIVVSHRKYLQAMIPGEIEKLKGDIGNMQKGHVTGSAKYGVFIEFNTCLTGMIHVNDLSTDYLKRHKNQDIKPGEELEFKIKDIISNTKITLTQVERVERVNPWNGVSGKYKTPCRIDGKIKSVKDYGVFIEIEEGVAGLLHISELPENSLKEYKQGNSVNVEISRIEEETRKVFLKI